jgi:DNA mismatch repair ATPase MutS
MVALFFSDPPQRENLAISLRKADSLKTCLTKLEDKSCKPSTTLELLSELNIGLKCLPEIIRIIELFGSPQEKELVQTVTSNLRRLQDDCGAYTALIKNTIEVEVEGGESEHELVLLAQREQPFEQLVQETHQCRQKMETIATQLTGKLKVTVKLTKPSVRWQFEVSGKDPAAICNFPEIQLLDRQKGIVTHFTTPQLNKLDAEFGRLRDRYETWKSQLVGDILEVRENEGEFML